MEIILLAMTMGYCKTLISSAGFVEKSRGQTVLWNLDGDGIYDLILTDPILFFSPRLEPRFQYLPWLLLPLQEL